MNEREYRKSSTDDGNPINLICISLNGYNDQEHVQSIEMVCEQYQPCSGREVFLSANVFESQYRII
jgi:hypothetical protein